MDKRKFTPAELLRSFELVHRHGSKDSTGLGRKYGAITATSGIDGYIVTLANSRAIGHGQLPQQLIV